MGAEELKLLAAAYLIALAVSAAIGVHGPLLAAPWRGLWAGFCLLVMTLTVGKVRLVPVARHVHRRGRRRVRGLRATFNDWRELRSDEPLPEVAWQRGGVAARSAEVTDADSLSAAAAEPVEVVPERTDGKLGELPPNLWD